MAIVFDEVEAAIEPGATRDPRRAHEASSAPSPQPDAQTLAKLRRELAAVERRKARLRAD